jgi:hypothetical protein
MNSFALDFFTTMLLNGMTGNRKEDFISERRKQLAEWLNIILAQPDFAFSAPVRTSSLYRSLCLFLPLT